MPVLKSVHCSIASQTPNAPAEAINSADKLLRPEWFVNISMRSHQSRQSVPRREPGLNRCKREITKLFIAGAFTYGNAKVLPRLPTVSIWGVAHNSLLSLQPSIRPTHRLA